MFNFYRIAKFKYESHAYYLYLLKKVGIKGKRNLSVLSQLWMYVYIVIVFTAKPTDE